MILVTAAAEFAFELSEELMTDVITSRIGAPRSIDPVANYSVCLAEILARVVCASELSSAVMS